MYKKKLLIFKFNFKNKQCNVLNENHTYLNILLINFNVVGIGKKFKKCVNQKMLTMLKKKFRFLLHFKLSFSI